jgi:hypothetical protein
MPTNTTNPWETDPPYFRTVFLERGVRPPETPVPQDSSATPARETRPLAAAAQPARFYSQYCCPICNDEISHKPGADFIGNTACGHRGPCTKSACIRAYYGPSDKCMSNLSG